VAGEGKGTAGKLSFKKGYIKMQKDLIGIHVKRRDFIKTTTLAGMAATLPGTSLLAQNTAGSVPRPAPTGTKRNLLLLSENLAEQQQLIESIKALKEFEFLVTPVKINFQQPQEITKAIQGNNPDILFLVLPRMGTTTGGFATAIGDLDIPAVLLPPNLDLIMLASDLAARLREKGITALLANSDPHAVEMVKIAAKPRILEGKRIVIFGKPFDSSSIPALNLNADYVYRRTGVRIQYRPIEDLPPLLASVDEAAARKEMERWKKEAVKVVEATDQQLLDSCKVYILLRSLIEKENLSGISIDCLSFSFNPKPLLPLPCLAFTRLRDEGFAAPCEADVCGLITSMVLQEISQKPSYFFNVSSVDPKKSSTVLRHCVAPLRLMGREAPPLPYNLRDYHGMGKGVTPEVEFPAGVEITMGGFTKDLKSVYFWPGRIIPGVHDTERPSFANATGTAAKMRMFCSNRAEVKIKDPERFIQSIAGIHHAMVAGNYTTALRDAMLRMNVNIISTPDSSAPEA
jgi:L-fucose isomerase-like protein